MESLIELLKMDGWTEFIAQIIGFIALIFAMVSYQMKTQKGIVLIQIVSCAFFAVHFLMLGAFTGGLTAAAGGTAAALCFGLLAAAICRGGKPRF